MKNYKLFLLLSSVYLVNSANAMTNEAAEIFEDERSENTRTVISTKSSSKEKKDDGKETNEVESEEERIIKELKNNPKLREMVLNGIQEKALESKANKKNNRIVKGISEVSNWAKKVSTLSYWIVAFTHAAPFVLKAFKYDGVAKVMENALSFVKVSGGISKIIQGAGIAVVEGQPRYLLHSVAGIVEIMGVDMQRNAQNCDKKIKIEKQKIEFMQSTKQKVELTERTHTMPTKDLEGHFDCTIEASKNKIIALSKDKETYEFGSALCESGGEVANGTLVDLATSKNIRQDFPNAIGKNIAKAVTNAAGKKLAADSIGTLLAGKEAGKEAINKLFSILSTACTDKKNVEEKFN